MKMKKLGFGITATALSFGLLASPTFAETPLNMNEKPQQLEIRVASTETTVSKSELIQKFKEIFPNKYDFLTDDDFYMTSGHYFPDDGIVRYDLGFHKRLSGNRYVGGSIVFAGENLEIERLYLDPIDVKDAMFPAKVSKEEAENIAKKFIEQFTASKNYKLTDDGTDYYYYGMNQPLTEPVQYSFSFVRMENGIKIPDQTISITVLGNGDITNLYRTSYVKATFDDAKIRKSDEEILNQIKENLSVELQYQVDWDYNTGDRKVSLVYAPTIKQGVNALTGQWLVGDSFQEKAPEIKKVEMLSKEKLPPRQQGITVEEAKAFAEELLKIDSDKVRLTIESIDETTDLYGNEMLYVNYSYHYERGGYGASIAFDKKTGEFVHFHNVKSEVLKEIGEAPKNKKEITKEQALQKAIEYLKEYMPSKLHQYSKPVQEATEDYWYYDGYIFFFPRVVNGIPVNGDQLQVMVTETGELSSIYSDGFENSNWPQISKAISEEEAKNKVLDSLSVELNYVKLSEEPHYNLVYTPIYNGNNLSYLDAISGEWQTPYYVQAPETGDEEQKVSHPTAEAELNYFIENGYLEIADIENFNPDAPITTGEAIQGLVKSLSYYYGDYYYMEDSDNVSQSFDNIGPDHPLYSIVEQAVSMGILVPGNSFNPNATITREELAAWYIRALGLDEAAKHSEIYKINVEDAGDVDEKYIGYVTLANTFGLIEVEDGKFNPKRTVTYAEFVTSAVRLAHKSQEMNVNHY